LVPVAAVLLPNAQKTTTRRRLRVPVAALLVLAVVGVVLGGGVVILGGLGASHGRAALTGLPTATGQPTATVTTTATATVTTTATATVTATNTSTPTPLLTLNPAPPVQIQLTQQHLGMCMTGGSGLSQTITNPGAQAISWSDTGFPAGARWDFNTGYSRSGQPGDRALASGHSDTLYIEVPCTDGPGTTFTVAMTDGANRTYRFTVYVMDG
jgi:hypothetical protein